MANKIYSTDETTISFNGTAGATVSWSLEGLASGSIQDSAQHDLGTASRSPRFWFIFYLKFQATPVVGQTVDLYLKTSDGTRSTNDEGTIDATLTDTDKLRNLRYIATLVVDEAATGVTMAITGTIEIPERYIQFVVHNGTDDQFSTTDSDCGLELIPAPYEIQ